MQTHARPSRPEHAAPRYARGSGLGRPGSATLAPRDGPLEALQRRADGSATVAGLQGYRALLAGVPVGGVVQRTKKGDKFSRGKVKIPLEGRDLYLATEDDARAHVEESPGTLRVNMRPGKGKDTLEDALPDPDKVEDRVHLLAAHAARVGQTGGDVCINCKSGKTRTPVVAIAYLIMSGLSVEAAIRQVAESYEAQRPGVGIDYDGKLTGSRLLDPDLPAKQRITTQVGDASLLDRLATLYGRVRPRSVQGWKELEQTARDNSQLRRKRLTPLWRAFDAETAREDERLASLGGGERQEVDAQVEAMPMELDSSGSVATTRPRAQAPRRKTPAYPKVKRTIEKKRAKPRVRRSEVRRLKDDFATSPYWNRREKR